LTSSQRSTDEVLLDDLVADLKDIVKRLHPDRHGGEFRNEDEKASYLVAQSALEKLEKLSRGGKSLAIRGSGDLASVEVARHLAEYQKMRGIEISRAASEQRRKTVREVEKKADHRFSTFRWISTSCAAMFAALLTVSDEAGHNSLVAPYLSGTTTKAAL
jgi:hypothetical protein